MAQYYQIVPGQGHSLTLEDLQRYCPNLCLDGIILNQDEPQYGQQQVNNSTKLSYDKCTLPYHVLATTIELDKAVIPPSKSVFKHNIRCWIWNVVDIELKIMPLMKFFTRYCLGSCVINPCTTYNIYCWF